MAFLKGPTRSAGHEKVRSVMGMEAVLAIFPMWYRSARNERGGGVCYFKPAAKNTMRSLLNCVLNKINLLISSYLDDNQP